MIYNVLAPASALPCTLPRIDANCKTIGAPRHTRPESRHPRGGLAGEHKIYFSARSICDPATSGYGSGTWETPCEIEHFSDYNIASGYASSSDAY